MKLTRPLSENFPPSRSWKARWIWAKDEGHIKNSYYYFRKEFSLSKSAKNFRIYITAETRYQLYLNGKFLRGGAPQSQPFFKYYDVYEVGSYLKSRDNCIGVIVNYLGNTPDTRGGLLAEITDGKGEPFVTTDTDWQVKRAEAWQENTFYFKMNKFTPYQELYDARKAPDGWTMPGFDDDTWDHAALIRGRTSNRVPAVLPWSYLVARDIPFMSEKPVLPSRIEYIEECLDIANRVRREDLSIALSACGGPIKYSHLQDVDNLLCQRGETIIQNSTNHLDYVFDGVYDPCIVLDFGKAITAFMELDLEGVVGGMVDIGYAERLIDGHFNNALEVQFADRYIMRDGRQTHHSFTWKGFRYVKLRFRSCFKKVKVHSVKAILTTYPFEERGSFHCDEDKLNAVFDICRYTIQLCSNEFIVDTPWREQGQWLGDVSAVTLGGIYACFGDVKLPAKFLRQSAANQLPTGLLTNVTNVVSSNWQWVLSDYSLWWIIALWNHYLYTGKDHWIHHFYPHVSKIVYTFLNYIDEYGLVKDMPYGIFIDWADVDKRGECAVLNALLYATLGVVEKMAELKQDSYILRLVQKARDGIKANFTLRFYDGKRGCFVDANIDGNLSVKVSEHANAAAILWELCHENIALEIIKDFYEKRSISYTEAQPFFTMVVLQALDKVGRFDLALEVIRERWGKRMVERGASSTYEEWGINGSWRSGEYSGFLRSQSHAWSAHPAEFLICNLIGLKILEAGCGKVQLRPKRVSFDYSVVFSTPLGPIRVVKRGTDIQRFVPEGVKVVD